MALFYFDTYDDDEIVADDTIGVELAGLEEARDQAAISLAELASDVLPGSVRRCLQVKVHDGQQPVLEASLTFEAVLLHTTASNKSH
jgi:hypothetical protein